jgi:hypothetical protein
MKPILSFFFSTTVPMAFLFRYLQSLTCVCLKRFGEDVEVYTELRLETPDAGIGSKFGHVQIFGFVTDIQPSTSTSPYYSVDSLH